MMTQKLRGSVPIFILTILICFYSVPANSAVGLGGYVPYVGTYQKDKDSGNTFDFKPFVSAVGRFNLFGPFVFRPEIGHVFSYRSTETSNSRQKMSTLFGLANFGYTIFSRTYFNFGIGTFWNKIESKAGEKSFNNGSSTATYYYPAGTSTSINSTLNLGIEQGFGKLSVSAMAYIFQILESEARNISYSLTLNYFL